MPVQNTRRNEQERIERSANEQSVGAPITSEAHHFQDKLEKLELENLELRKKSWSLQGKSTVPISIILSGIGGTILFLSYLLTSSILTFIGLGLAFWGVLMIYLSSTRHIHSEVLNSISLSMQKCVDDVVTYMGYQGEVIFFHPKNLAGLGQGHVFISHYTAKEDGTANSKLEALNLLPYNNAASTPSIFLHPRGMFLIAPGQGLLDLFEKELGINLGTVEFSYIQQALPKLLIEDLKVVDDLLIEEIEDSLVVMSFSGGPGSDLCTYFQNNTKLGKSLGCPLCSTVALALSKVSGKPVMIRETKTGDNSKITTTFSMMNP